MFDGTKLTLIFNVDQYKWMFRSLERPITYRYTNLELKRR